METHGFLSSVFLPNLPNLNLTGFLLTRGILMSCMADREGNAKSTSSPPLSAMRQHSQLCVCVCACVCVCDVCVCACVHVCVCVCERERDVRRLRKDCRRVRSHQRSCSVESSVYGSFSPRGVPHLLQTKHSGWYMRVIPTVWGEGQCYMRECDHVTLRQLLQQMVSE